MPSSSAGAVALYAPRDDVPGIETSVHLSQGICLAQTTDDTAPYYVHGARVPVPNWRLPTQEESAAMWSKVPPPAHCGVGLVRLLGPGLIRLVESRSDVFVLAEDAATLDHPLTRMLLDFIVKAGICISRLHSARIGRDEPGRITMTKAVDANARIGLHLDHWDRQPLDRLESCTNRISINLGPADRYFVFVNRTARGMLTMLQQDGTDSVRDVDVIGKAFMAAFPDYPVIRIRLRPGEAYIAPTENILHDGSSTEVRTVNRYLSIRGRLDFAVA